MDFKTLKQKAIEAKQKAVEFKNKTIEKTAQQVSKSSLVIKNNEELEYFITKSENKTFVDKEWTTKIFEKRVFVIFGDSKNKFFEEMLIAIPILYTKSFSQSTSFKLVDINNEKIDLKKYSLEEYPSMVVFENKEVYKIIAWEKNIKKVVNSFTLDINKTIEEL